MDVRQEANAQLKLDFIQGADGRAQLQALLDRTFPVPPNSHFFDDFPIWDESIMNSPGHIRRIGVFHQKALVACAGVRIAELKSTNGNVPIALIGAVATAPEWRNQGFASIIVTQAVKLAETSGAALAVLWGSEYELYQRLGFELCGQQVRIALGDLRVPQPTLATKTGWADAIATMMKIRRGGLVVSDTDVAWIRAHRNVKWFSNSNAYAALGRGIDLTGLVHEWGGEKQALAQLLASIRAQHPEAAILGSPTELTAAGLITEPARAEYLCMARVFDPARIIAAFRPGSPVKVAQAQTGWNFTLGGQEINLPGESLAPFLFNGFQEMIGTEWEKHLPLPLWLWGLDGA